MTSNDKLLPLTEYLYGREARDNERVVTVADAHAYAIRNVAHAAEPLKAEIEALRAEVGRLRDIVRPRREDACLTTDHWRMRAYDLEANWDRASRAANSEATAREAAEARAERLAEALRELLIDMMLAQSAMRRAAKTDPRWGGCAEAIQPRVDAARAALRDHDQEGSL